MHAIIHFVSFLFGLCFGSFANVCIARMPADQSIFRPRSRCPGCLEPIRAWDNIPLVSFAILRGKCRHCGQRISWQYPAVELSVALLFVFNSLYWEPSVGRTLVTDVLAFYGVTISVIDFHHRIIPDELSLSLLVLGLLVAWINPFLLPAGWMRLAQSAGAMFVGGGMMLALAWVGEKVFKQEALGGGDIKLVAAFGSLLGWAGFVGSLFWGGLLGAGIGIALILTGKKQRRDTIPFGPFLCLGAYITAFLPSAWIRLIFP